MQKREIVRLTRFLGTVDLTALLMLGGQGLFTLFFPLEAISLEAVSHRTRLQNQC